GADARPRRGDRHAVTEAANADDGEASARPGPGRGAAVRPPSVDAVLVRVRAALPGERDPDALRDAARAVVDAERQRPGAGDRAVASADELAAETVARLESWADVPAAAAINATGVVIHTNLGRAPWPAEAILAAREASGGLLLELVRSSGRRGARF